MRNFPVFSTEYGVGNLILQEVPYSGAAYIRVQDVTSAKDFINECVSFSKAVGASHLFATGHPCLAEYPYHTEIIEMTASRDQIPATDSQLFPVTDRTLERWISIYNDKMRNLPNFSYMTFQNAQHLMDGGQAYFIHRSHELLGIGAAENDRILALASMQPQAGAAILSALCSLLIRDTVVLEVAAQNHKAISLYERMGFIRTCILSRWVRLM